MSGLLELAERCEKSDGPTWELDQAIGIARANWVHPESVCIGVANCPPFTASIDRAVSLIPDGQEWAYLDGQAIVRFPKSFKHEFGNAATPALALCAAALRARAAQ